jgi:flagellin
LETVQSRISTGLRVAEASDNAAYWSIATTMRSDNKALSSVQDSLGLGASRIDTAYTAMNSAIDIVDEIKQKLVAAIGASSSDKEKIQAEISEFQKQLKFVADAATFSGQNWLSVDSSVANGHAVAGVHDGIQIVSSFNRSSSGAISLGTIEVDVQAIKLFDAAGATSVNKGIVEGLRLGTSGDRDNTATAAVAGTVAATDGYSAYTLTVVGFLDEQIDQMLLAVDETLADLTDAASVIGASKKRVDMQKSFTSSLMDSIDRGIGQLVDADMNKESSRLQALQVQQQLGIQSLSIANSTAQNVLSLFRS